MYMSHEDWPEIFFPQLKMMNAKQVTREMHFGAKDLDYYWFQRPHHFEYQQTLRITIYCSFDFKDFPFDSHDCNINYGSSVLSINLIQLKPTKIRFKGMQHVCLSVKNPSGKKSSHKKYSRNKILLA